MKITREETESFKDDKTGIGQLADRFIDIFPMSEWTKRKAMRDAMEEELRKTFSKMFPPVDK